MDDAKAISDFIQSELAQRNLCSVTAIGAAKWLEAARLLKDSATRRGKPLRDLLRAKMIRGQRQEMDRRWYIDRVDAPVRREPGVKTRRTVLARGSIKRFAEARKRYRPKRVRYALVAESPPKADSGRFFYFEDVPKGDSLFWETMKALYPDKYPPGSPPRHRKREFLERFRDEGFYLLDAVDEPLGKVSPTLKRQRIRESLARLRQDLRSVCAGSTKVVLDDQKKFKPAALQAVRHFAKMKPWRGTVEERQEKFRSLNRALAGAYGVEQPRLVFGTDKTKDSGSSCYIARLNTIILRGRLSVVTFFHEWGHRLHGRSEYRAARWSINLFRRVFPRCFARCRWDGHMLRAAPTGRSANP